MVPPIGFDQGSPDWWSSALTTRALLLIENNDKVTVSHNIKTYSPDQKTETES